MASPHVKENRDIEVQKALQHLRSGRAKLYDATEVMRIARRRLKLTEPK